MLSMRGKQHLLLLSVSFLLFLLFTTTSALLPTKTVGTAATVSNRRQLSVLSSTRTAAPTFTTRTMTTMYFDDVSRHAMNWKPKTTDNNMRVSYQPMTTTGPPTTTTEGEGSDTTAAAAEGIEAAAAAAVTTTVVAAAEEKLDAVKRLLLGYDAESASQLTTEEILELVDVWATKSGVVGDYFGDELYSEVTGTTVCQNATHFITALAHFWKSIADIIDQHTDEFRPLTWTTSPESTTTTLTDKDSSTSKQKKRHFNCDNNPSILANDQIHFVVFPACTKLYDYKNMFTFLTAVEFSKDLCLHLGTRFTLTLFHPKFKNSPILFSPERHSPFPIAGLEIKHPSKVKMMLQNAKKDNTASSKDEKMSSSSSKSNTAPKRQRGNAVYQTPKAFGKGSAEEEEDDEDEHLDNLIESRIRDLEERRDILEVLFNSPAVAGSDTDTIVSVDEYYDAAAAATVDVDDDDENVEKKDLSSSESRSESPEELLAAEALTLKFQKARQLRRRGMLPKNKVISMCKMWMQQNRYTTTAGGSSKKEINRALQFMDSVVLSSENENDYDSWTVSTHKIAEKVYADLWRTISDLHEIGQLADEEASAAAKEASTKAAAAAAAATSKGTTKNNSNIINNPFDWMKAFGRPFQVSAVVGSSNSNDNNKQQPPTQQKMVVKSSVFVATKFCAYNAQSFKRFAITVNAALKRLTDGRMFIEVFHPEYVGNKGYNSALRRSPFPMIQICYQVKPRSSS